MRPAFSNACRSVAFSAYAATLAIGCGSGSEASLGISDVKDARVVAGGYETNDVEALIFDPPVVSLVDVFLSRDEPPCSSMSISMCDITESGTFALTPALSCDPGARGSLKASIDFHEGCPGEPQHSWWSSTAGSLVVSSGSDTADMTLDATMSALFDGATSGAFHLAAHVRLDANDADHVGH